MSVNDKFKPVDAAVVPRFADIATFMRTRRYDLTDETRYRAVRRALRHGRQLPLRRAPRAVPGARDVAADPPGPPDQRHQALSSSATWPISAMRRSIRSIMMKSIDMIQGFLTRSMQPARSRSPSAAITRCRCRSCAPSPRTRRSAGPVRCPCRYAGRTGAAPRSIMPPPSAAGGGRPDRPEAHDPDRPARQPLSENDIKWGYRCGHALHHHGRVRGDGPRRR